MSSGIVLDTRVVFPNAGVIVQESHSNPILTIFVEFVGRDVGLILGDLGIFGFLFFSS